MSSDHSTRHGKSETGAQVASDLPGPGFTELQLRIRELVESLKQGILDAISKASAAEIAEFMRTADLASARALLSGPRGAPPRQNDPEPAANGDALGRRSRWQDRALDHARDAVGSLNTSQDPFDITSPGELLASTQETGQAFGHSFGSTSFGFESPAASTSDLASTFDEIAPAADAPSMPSERGLRARPPVAAESTVALPVGDREAESERRPRIVLREGERLLSATGSGVVIRRERRIAPTR